LYLAVQSIDRSSLAAFSRTLVKVGPLIAVVDRQGGKGMNVWKDGSCRLVLCCVVVLEISSVALMPQHGDLISTGPGWIDALWVAGDKGLLKMDVSDASPLLEIADIGHVRAVDIDDRRGLVWAFSKDQSATAILPYIHSLASLPVHHCNQRANLHKGAGKSCK